MIILLSPAKSLDFERQCPAPTNSFPPFLEGKTKELIELLKAKSPADIAKLMSLSKNLSELNYQRFQDFTLPYPKNLAGEAAFVFTGDVYQGLDIVSFTKKDLKEAQNKIRILSGLYGLLRPLDLILPYRLEMGTRLKTAHGTNLYQFWGQEIVSKINKEDSDTILNLASNEYFKAASKGLSGTVINPIFKDEKNGKYKVISFYAKKARGLMARWVVLKRVDSVKELPKFDIAGYQFSPEESQKNAPVFKRSEAARLSKQSS